MNQETRNLQYERLQRGLDFQDEIRQSWHLIPNIWRSRIKDGDGGTRPADEIILTDEVNILAEMKRTKGDTFKLSMLRPNQIKGLVDFDQIINRNYGLVFVSFLNKDKNMDYTYAFRLITALNYMKNRNKVSITLDEFRHKKVPCIRIPRLDAYLYDLGGINTGCRYL